MLHFFLFSNEYHAKDDIEINGGSNIQIKGHSGIKLIQAGASITIKDDVTINGKKVNVQN